jgi:hypothetical protein
MFTFSGKVTGKLFATVAIRVMMALMDAFIEMASFITATITLKNVDLGTNL